MWRDEFKGKVVLVTGGSRGMGAAFLEAFAQAGATCVLSYLAAEAGQSLRDAEQTAGRLRGFGNPVHLFEADVSKFESVEALMKRVAAELGGLDILVNNAGILRDRTVKKMTPG